MLQYIVKRTLVLIPLLLALSIVVFIIIQLPPGDYLTTYINQLRSTGMEVTEDQIKALEARYGFDQPMYIQYLKWMKNLLKGDMGYSFVYNRPVNALVGSRLPATIAISLVSTILIWLIFGSMLCGIGPFVAMHILMKNMNALAHAYNVQHNC